MHDTDQVSRVGCGGLEGAAEHHDVIVVGGGQAGLAIGHFLTRQGATSRSSRRQTSRRPRGASGGTRCGCSRRCATAGCPACLPRRSRRLSRAGRRGDYLTDYARHFACRSQLGCPGCGQSDPPVDAGTSSSPPTAATRPPRWYCHRPVPGPVRSIDCRRSSTTKSSSSTAALPDAGKPPRRSRPRRRRREHRLSGRRRSSRPRARSTCRSDRGWPGFRSES